MIGTHSVHSFDTAIIGSGFGGSILAMILRHSGQKVLLIEKKQHPRFAIGESSTPLANLLLEEIARDSCLPNLLNLTEWGRWQTNLPQLPCGLKRGFSFYKHVSGSRLKPHDRSTQLLVAASPTERVADTHWYRPSVDEFLVNEAISHDVDYRSNTSITELTRGGESWELVTTSQERSCRVQAKFIVDASGQHGFLPRYFGFSHSQPVSVPRTQALFAHFTNVPRLEDCDEGFCSPAPPYPVDDAAVHHIIDGGWVWVLRFNNGVTSVGVVLEAKAADAIGLRGHQSGWQALLNIYPSLGNLFGTAKRITDWHYVSQVASKVEGVVGDDWALLPSAAGFIDPMLSTGFPLTLLGIQRLAKILTNTHAGNSRRRDLKEYEAVTLLELEHTAELIGALYANFENFENFRDLTLMYFAAASFAETVRRLGHPECAQGFLLASDPRFGIGFLEICRMTRLDPSAPLRQRILGLIKPFDIAGLTKAGTNNWYPVRLEDLLNNAEKTGSSREEIMAMLRRCGLSN